MTRGPTSNPEDLNEADLLPHGCFTQYVFGHEAVWVRTISGPPTAPDPIVSLGIKQLALTGHISQLLDRLRAAVGLLEQVDERRDDWDLLLSRLPRGTRRTWPHPFTDDPSERTDEPRSEIADAAKGS